MANESYWHDHTQPIDASSVGIGPGGIDHSHIMGQPSGDMASLTGGVGNKVGDPSKIGKGPYGETPFGKSEREKAEREKAGGGTPATSTTPSAPSNGSPSNGSPDATPSAPAGTLYTGTSILKPGATSTGQQMHTGSDAGPSVIAPSQFSMGGSGQVHPGFANRVKLNSGLGQEAAAEEAAIQLGTDTQGRLNRANTTGGAQIDINKPLTDMTEEERTKTAQALSQ